MSQEAPEEDHRVKHAVVIVLGDIGRSPRMQYHTLSLLEDGHFVTLIGYAGEGLIPPLEMVLTHSSDDASSSSLINPLYHGHLHVLHMVPYQPPKTKLLCRLLYYPLRLLSLSYCVIHTLWVQLNNVPHTTKPVDVILVQNPPSMPTLLLAYLYCVWQGIFKRHRPRLVIDWHNLGYTMFEAPAANSSRVQAMVQKSIRNFAKWYERCMAPLADAHLTVTQAMEVWLGENFNVCGPHVRVCYDKPPLMFQPTSVEEQHELFRRLNLGNDILQVSHDDMTQEEVIDETIFTQSIRERDGSTSVRLRKDRPALLVSSTSWTPDEDFSILLVALRELHKWITTLSSGETFPKVLVIVTGKGPQKQQYVPLLKKFNKTHAFISIQTLWLESGDYPKLLGCATLGVCLHTSTSGLDLPMKVLDMFGCQVPVCAIAFDCLQELVKDDVNGRIFKDGDELANQLFDLLVGFNDDSDGVGTMKNKLEMYRQNIRGMTRWKENWEECARHLIVGGGEQCR
jgi:beta-1,4-mannosyltransferase